VRRGPGAGAGGPGPPAARPARRRGLAGWLALAAWLGLGPVLAPGAAHAGSFWLVSAAGVQLRPGERIVGFELTVRAGRVAALRTVPAGWSVTVDNEPAAHASASGGILIGAAALDPAELADFFVVESYGPPDAARVDVELVLEVTTDFARERRVVVPRDRLGLRPR
jgi:hypothetical protein